MKRILQSTLCGVTALIIVLIVIISTSFEARISLLLNLHQSEECRSISSSDIWVGCGTTQDFQTQVAYINLYSTKFPFNKMRIDLPALGLTELEGYYENIDVISWSPNSDSFVVTVRKMPNVESHHICIVKIDSSSSYEVNCYPKGGVSKNGSVDWSTDGKSLLYSDYLNATTRHFVVLDLNAQEINQFNVSFQNYLPQNEELGVNNVIWNGSDLYLELIFTPERQGITSFGENRSDVVRISIANPEKVESLLLGEKNQFYQPISVDPDGKFLLVARKVGTEYNGFLLIDVKNGRLVKEIATDEFSNLSPSCCLANCSKTAIDISGNRTELLIWSWKDMKFTSYQRSEFWSILGKDNTHNGFLGFWNVDKKTGVLGVTLYR